jgi:hypothetical protein
MKGSHLKQGGKRVSHLKQGGKRVIVTGWR